ncbi:MAG: ubiquinone biosynthesis regulatory protein kinase UbiB, partial [Betaproteobacteria bacterium]
MQRLLRLARIIIVSIRFGLDEFVLAHARTRLLLVAVQRVLFWRRLTEARAVRLRLALEALGPLFVKFGQMLSTRRDLLPADIADELARLQDQVPPFSTALAHAQLERAFGRPVAQVFEQFEALPVASASIAQVHFAVLPGGRECAVKILRPNMQQAIEKDLALLDSAAGLIEALWIDGRRLKPREVVTEFAKHLNDELDLMREAANASQLRRNFAGSPLLMIPEIYWDYCSSTV